LKNQLLRNSLIAVLGGVQVLLALGQAPRPSPKASWLDADKSEPAGTHYRTFKSQLAGGEVSYLIYLPPTYETERAQRYPVVYWLHGLNGNQRAGATFVENLDAAVRTGKAPAMIVVLVNGMVDSFYNDSPDGKWPIESVIVKELIPHIDKTYRTVARRESRAVEGYSMGGFGVAHLGFKYPEMFGRVSIMAGAIIDYDDEVSRHDPIGIIQKMFGNDKAYFEANHPSTLVKKNADSIRGRTAVRIAVGDQDGLLPRSQALHELLVQLKIEHEYEVVPGVGHNTKLFYKLLGERAFALYQKAPAVKGAIVQDRLAWWKEDRFGMFMHWGLYAIYAGEWNGQTVPGIGEWIMKKGKIPVREYEQLAKRFNPAKFDAEEWVRIAKAAGQRYIVITAKHHDGFAMWHSKASKFNVYDATPFHRDPLAELVQACRRNGLRIGFYYSQTQDWHEPDGDGNDWDFKPSEKNFDKYFHEKVIPQVRELLTEYGPVPFMWFDTPKIITAAQSKELVGLVHSLQPDCLVNARVGNEMGDFKGVGDQEIPAKVQDSDWETVVSLNDSWGFKKSDTNWKPAQTLIRQLADIVSKNGFFSLNVGPDADGLIPQPEVERLQTVGAWLRVNGEAIYGAKPSPYPYEFDWGSVTAKPGRLYLELSQWPAKGEFTLYGLSNKVGKAYALASRGTAIRFSQSDVQGRHELHLKMPASKPDPNLSVIALEIEGAPEVEPELVQQPDGKVTLSCAFAKVEGAPLDIDARGVAQNWLNSSSTLDWNFKLYRPGAYEVVLLTNVRRNASDWTLAFWSGDHQVAVSVGNSKVEGRVEHQGEVIDPRSPNFPDVRTVIGKVTLSSPGELHLKIQALKINPDRKLGLRLHTIQLVPVEKGSIQ
jgi:alpha-L-fucosidase